MRRAHPANLGYAHDIAFVPLLLDHDKAHFIGVCRYSVSDEGSTCECAVTVLDA